MKTENIKFKAKRLDSGEWVYGYFYEENGNTYIIENRQKESMLNRNVTYEVDPSTICLFTGLKDKNGIVIYENDILKYDDGKILFTKPVEYRKGAFRIGCNLLYILQDSESFIKIIGNKFDKEK